MSRNVQSKAPAVAGGHWLPTATVTNTPAGNITWHGVPRRGYSAMVETRCVGKVRWVPAHKQWHATLEGWVWDVTSDMGAARFGLKETPVKAFKHRPEAQTAIEQAWAVPRHSAGHQVL